VASRVSRRRVNSKGLLVVLTLALIAAGVIASGASALAIADAPCPTVAGENTNTCPPGTEGVPYSIRFEPREGSGCGPGRQVFGSQGAVPPGLSLAQDGLLSGTPTQAGSYQFYVVMSTTPPYGSGCNFEQTEKQFTLVINPGVPKLTIGPEAAPIGTVGAPYSLQMTASVADPKVWSIAEGQLPAGLTLDPSSGLISGTPVADGSFSFLVNATIADGRVDTKWLTIAIRRQLSVATSAPLAESGRTTWEVGVPFSATLTASGGSETFTFSLAGGSLPTGIAVSADGTVQGTPSDPGSYRAAVLVADSEGRAVTSVLSFLIAPRLAIATARLSPGRVGKAYRAKLVTTGGVAPRLWIVTRGPLPRGVKLDRRLGVLSGVPKKAGRYKLRLQVRDSLGVRSTKSYLVIVKAVPKPKKPKR
jgi:large repetitive protein